MSIKQGSKKYNKLYDKNIEALKVRHQDVVDRINGVHKSDRFEIRNVNKSNLPNIYIKDMEIYYYDKLDPMRHVKKYMDELNLKKTNMAVFLGFGLGYEVLYYGRYLAERLQTRYVIIIERSIELFKEAIKCVDLTLILNNENVVFFVGEENNFEMEIKNYFTINKLSSLENISAIYYPSAFKLDKDYYLKLLDIFNKTGAKMIQNYFLSKDIYSENMKVLKKINSNLANKIENTDEKKYSIVKTGTKNMYNIWINDLQKYYYDLENPIEDTNNQIKILNLKNTRLALILGVGLGYELEVFKNNIAIQQKTETIIIIEKDTEMMKCAMKVTDLTGYFKKKKILFVIGEKQEDIFYELEKFFRKYWSSIIFLKTTKAVYHYSSLKIDKEYYLKAIGDLKKIAVYELGRYGNSVEDNFWGIENILKNMKEIINNPGINLLFDKFKGKPAIAIGSGPSLGKNIELLKGMQNKALLISAESTLRPLLRNGIKPHMVAILERTKGASTSFEDINEEEFDNVYLAACPVVDERVYEIYKGPRIVVYRDFGHFRWLKIERGILPIKQSSGIMAFELAMALGADPIILLGQDCSYEDGTMISHSNNIGGGLEKRSASHYQRFEHMKVKGNRGNMVLTHAPWLELIQGFEIDLKSYKGTCINNDSCGAYFKGSIVKPFKDTVKEYLGEDIYPLKIIEENLGNFKNVTEDYEKVIKIIKSTLKDIKEMYEIVKDGAVYFNDNYKFLEELLVEKKFNSEKMKNKVMSLKEKTYSYKNILDDKLDTFNLFLAHIAQSFMLNFEMKVASIPEKFDNEIEIEINILLAQKEWFHVMENILERCVDLLESEYENLTGELYDDE